jgi:hypothetical protein
LRAKGGLIIRRSYVRGCKIRDDSRLIGMARIFCFWAVRELGVSLTDLARRLGMRLAGVGYAVQRGEVMARELSPFSQPLYHYFYRRQHGADGKPQSHPMPKTYGYS